MFRDCPQQPVFPAQSAFVVQWHRTARLKAGQIIGRVEHVVSRQTTTFDSLDGLFEFMQGVLDDHQSASENP